MHNLACPFSGMPDNLVQTILCKIDLVYVWAVRSDSMILHRFNKVLYELHLQVKYFTSCNTIAMILNGLNKVLYKLQY